VLGVKKMEMRTRKVW